MRGLSPHRVVAGSSRAICCKGEGWSKASNGRATAEKCPIWGMGFPSTCRTERFSPVALPFYAVFGRGVVLPSPIWTFCSDCLRFFCHCNRGERSKAFQKNFKLGVDSIFETAILIYRWFGNGPVEWAVSSGGEHYLDTVGVTSSNLVSPTI